MDPIRYGYRFDGWKIDQGNGGTISIETISLAQIKEYGIDGVLYIRAKWTQLTIIKTAEDFANILQKFGKKFTLSIKGGATACKAYVRNNAVVDFKSYFSCTYSFGDISIFHNFVFLSKFGLVLS